MSGRNWLHHAAVGGWLIALAIGAFGDSVLAQANQPNGPAPDAKAQTEQTRPDNPSIPPPPEKKNRPASEYETLCERAQNREDRDLCQQWRMAQAAAEQVIWAGRQFWTAVIGIGAVVITIVLTALATKAASKAAKAAQKSVEVAERTAEQQLRAYVFIACSRRVKPRQEDPWHVEIQIKNFGQTPAYRVLAYIDMAFVPAANAPAFVPSSPHRGPMLFDLAPTQDFTIRQVIPGLDGQMWQEFKAGRQYLFVWGRADFTDAFGKVRWITFRMYQDGSAVLNLLHCVQGNDTSESDFTGAQHQPRP